MSGNFHAERYGQIFSEDEWRDPSDDIERLAYYIFFAFAMVAGVVGIIASAVTLYQFDPKANPRDAIPIPLLWVLIGLGATFAIGSGYILFRESRRWNLRKPTAEKFVAGIFCFGLAITTILVWGLMEGSVGGLVFFTYGLPIAASILFIAYLVGLLSAYFPKWFPRQESIECTFVHSRFAIDYKAMQHDDYETPYEDGMTGYVVLRKSCGGLRRFRASYGAYELCRPGKVGNALVKNGILSEFREAKTPARNHAQR